MTLLLLSMVPCHSALLQRQATRSRVFQPAAFLLNPTPVLSECSSLVGADTRCGSKSFYSLQVLDQASLCSHPLGSESETHGDSGQKTLGYIGHNDTNKEDDGIEPIVTQDKCNDEEGDTEEDSDSRDDVNEMLDLLGNGCLSTSKSRSKTCNPTHDCVVSNVDHHAYSGSFNSIGGEESEILGF